MRPSPISAAAALSSRCARRSTPPRTLEEATMNQHVKLSRRAFVIGSAAAGTGLALGLDIPFGGPTAVRAAEGFPDEVNCWVVIKPDDTVVIRIARSEMGQGSLTGLAQLVAE